MAILSHLLDCSPGRKSQERQKSKRIDHKDRVLEERQNAKRELSDVVLTKLVDEPSEKNGRRGSHYENAGPHNRVTQEMHQRCIPGFLMRRAFWFSMRDGP